MSVSIAIHVDGYYGLIEGVKNILNLLNKYKIRASFFVSMGREANWYELLKYKRRQLTSRGGAGVTKRYSKFQLLKMALLARKLGSGNYEILREIKRRGHEVNPHAWVHMKWSKGFKDMSPKNEIGLMKESYFNCFKKYPIGLSPPEWRWNGEILKEMKNLDFKYLGVDTKIKAPQFNKDILLIPLSFKDTPEELWARGFNAREIINKYKEHLENRDNANLYFHADYEGLKGRGLFEKILNLLENEKIVTYEQIYKKLK